MNMRERRLWLSQINRIHSEQKYARDRETVEQLSHYMNLRAQEGEK
jgi:hypothetical protein